MARIRSIHPGFFTDEELVCVSMAARLLFLGLGVEADDKGVFEWKPLTIKMKIFPADNLDVDVLLSELVHANAIRRYEIDGRSFGAIRNFRKFQRPKTPNDIHPATPEIRNYVGLEQAISETLPQSGGTPSEIAPQMEDGGDKGSSVSNETDASASIDPVKIMFDNGVGIITASGKSEQVARAWLGKARKAHGVEAVIAALGKAKREGAIDPIPFMEGCFKQVVRREVWEAPC